MGNVISLNPEEGSVVEEGSDVTVAVSIGEGTAYADVPNVIGMSEETAVSAVKAVNLIPSVQYDYSADARVGIEKSLRSVRRQDRVFSREVLLP